MAKILLPNITKTPEAYFRGISAAELQKRIREIIPGQTGEDLANGVRVVELSNCTRYTEEYDSDKDERRDKDIGFEGAFPLPSEDEENNIPPGVEVCRTKYAADTSYVRCEMQTFERGYQLILALRKIDRRIEAYRIDFDDLSSSMCLEIEGIAEDGLSLDCWRFRCKDIINRHTHFESRFVDSVRSLFTAPFCCPKHLVAPREEKKSDATTNDATSPWKVQFRAKRKYDAEALLQMLKNPLGSPWTYLIEQKEPELTEISAGKKKTKNEFEFHGSVLNSDITNCAHVWREEWETKRQKKKDVSVACPQCPQQTILGLAKRMQGALGERLVSTSGDGCGAEMDPQYDGDSWSRWKCE